MRHLSQREKHEITRHQKEAYEAYLLMCASLNEVPRPDIVILISGCTVRNRLIESTEIFKSKTNINPET